LWLRFKIKVVRCSVGGGDPNENGVRCYSPSGDLIGKIHIPETVANLGFDGQHEDTWQWLPARQK